MMGIKDAINAHKPALTDDQMKRSLQNYQAQRIAELKVAANKVASANLAAANRFMAENAKKAGVKTIAPGLQYKVLIAGHGPKPKITDSVKVDYEGRRAVNDKVFDSSYRLGKPVTFKLNQVIKGWSKALTQMPQGSTWMIYIGPKLAYGTLGTVGTIGPNEALIFKVHLIKVEK